MRRRDRRIKYVVLGVFAAVVSLTFLLGRLRSNDADAASLANFDPGFIISDYTMSNYNSMTQAEIQSFLTRKNPCSNSDYDYYLSLTANNPGVYWHWKDGHFVCISEELFGEGTTIGEGKTAAQIIYETAQEYRINPQVLLVLIQKESSLITDPIPNNYDYRAMTGFGCPDTAPCDSKYYGFKNQIRKAAWLFREVLDGGWTNYPVGDNYIQYNPNSGCGGSIVNVKNLATSALYRYTPYQPNAGAIAAGYGTAYCGAYGNRNFYLYFEDWFGGITDDFNISALENARIPDGVYSIKNLGSGKMMDIAGGTKTATNGTSVHAWNNNNTNAQRWKISNLGDGTFKITNPTVGLALDGYDTLTIEKNDNVCSQKWKILKYGNGHMLVSSCLDAVLQVTQTSADKIILGNATRGETIKWKIDPVDADIEEGEYAIRSVLNNNKTINAIAQGGSVQIATDIRLSTFSGDISQIWKIVKNSDGTYSFNNLNNTLTMDVEGGSTKKGANVRMWSQNGSCAQKWKAVRDNDLYVFVSACSDLVLDVDGGIPNEKANIHLWWFNNTSAQKWKIEKIERQEPVEETLADGEYVIKSKIDTSKAIDIAGGAENASDGENIQLWRSNNTNAQIWRVSHNEADDTYSIANPYTGKALDVDGAQTVRGANIQLWNSNYTCAQKWHIKKDGDYMTLTSACSELVLDVSGGIADFGANINLWTTNGTDAQKWLFEPIAR